MKGLSEKIATVPAVLLAVFAVFVLAACGGGSAAGTGQSVGGPPSTTLAPSRRTTRTRPARTPRATRPRSPATGLADSIASAQVVQAQPAAGSCHAIGAGLYARPDPHCTPGAVNPAVTQANIHETICQPGWTSTVRPPERVTEAEKAQSMAAYGDLGPMSGYEYDHLIPLELGGAVNDPRNLWPEPGASPNPKDAVEDSLNQKVCEGRLTLAQAQRAIAADWPKLTVHRLTTTADRCSATAARSKRYDDFDVYVHSNQPDQTVTVSDSSGRSAGWRTDASGYADVYFKAPGLASGETLVVHVGSASCRTAL